MDLPATQAMGEDELPATQQFAINEDQEKTLVGTLLINRKTYSIFSGLTKIGRHPECQIVLDYETVSKRHAEIEAESPNKTVFIRDLNSSNQTRINKSKIRPNSLYQIRDGDELIFGNVIASFKLYQPIDDSLVSCTPQVHRKLKAIIPGTPDSSMNTSSASEGDTSIIPGTQMDKTDPNFRLPEIPVRSSKSDEHKSPKVPAFTLDDLPSPLNKEKSRQDDICEAETQRFSTSDTKENDDNTDNIYTAATQKASSVTKALNADDNIYDMATQRPTDSDEETNELENLTTQRPDYKYPESSKVLDNRQSINDLETQIFNSSNKKSLEVSIYSAATQKNVPDTLNNESIEDLETQQFNLPKMDIDSRKSNDVSIYSAATQKNDYDKSNSKSIEDLETQAFDTRKSNVSNQKSNDVSIYSAETQKNVHDESVESIENLETQQFDKRTSNTLNNSSHDVSIYSAVTQKKASEDFNKSIENLETQPFDTQKTALKKTTHDLSIHSAATQKVNNDTPHESIENIETQNFDINKPEKFVAPSPLRRKCNKSLYDAETQRCVPNESISESIEHMETQQFTTNTTDTSKAPTTNKVPNKYIYADDTQKRGSAELKNKSIDNLEIQQFVNIANEIIDDSTESLHLVDESPQMISSLSFTSQNESHTDTKHIKESSFDSGIQRTEQENDQNDTSEDQNNSDIQFKKPSINTSKMINDKEDDALKSTQNIEEGKSILEGENEEEMFSQNLIEDCPFAFLPEESTSDENQFITSKNEENNEFNACKPHNIINESDSETDEEGVFTNHSSNKDKSNQSNSKCKSETKKGAIHKEADSETDEEGVFSNHLSNQSESDNKNNKQDRHENSENDSETDEEGVFSDRMVKEKKNKSKKDNDVDSDEDIFDNILEVDKKTKLRKSKIFPSKSNSSICEQSPTRDSQDLMFHDNYEIKINSIQKPQTTNTHSSADKEINGIEIEDLAPIQVINSDINDTDIFLAPTQVICKEKGLAEMPGENLDNLDLAPTQKIVDTQVCIESLISAQDSSRQSNNRCNTKNTIDLEPTQRIADDTELCTESQFATPIDKQLKDCSSVQEKLDLAPTQIIANTQLCTESQFSTPIDKQIHDQNNVEKILDLEPTQIFANTEPCIELQLTKKINDELRNDQNNPININPSSGDLEYKNAPAQVNNDLECKMLLNQSKRQLEELDITCKKKVKITDNTQNVNLDYFANVEKNLDEMFEGPENEPVELDQSALLTQQLANILEYSQNDDSLVKDSNESKPSPTLSSGRNSKMKNRRKELLLRKPGSLSPLVNPVINLNDTIERNLNELFDNSVNNTEAFETDEMMTQQLKNILQSQDDHHKTINGAITETKSPVLCKTYERRRHRLDLPVSLNASSASMKQEQQTPKSSSVQSSSSNKLVESEETDEYFANLKSSKKCNVIDTQSDEEPMTSQSSIDSEREIVCKSRMVGSSAMMRPVSTKEPVPLLKPKGRSFTSDSQSDGDESSSVRTYKKRFSLSLSKHVDLNSSLSSSDQEMGKKLSTKPSTPSLKQRGNNHLSTSHQSKRVLARGTRGFTSKPELQPIETEELVSAASTESDEELRSFFDTNKKVCTSKLYRKVTVNLTKLSPLTVAKSTSKISTSEKASDSDSDDSEFLKSMPCIKVAGTADCPPTNSQLAAPSDFEDDDDENSLKVPSPVDIVIPTKYNWYRQKRFDLVYKKDTVKSPKNTSMNDDDENRARSPSFEKHDAKILSVDDILAEIDANKPIGKRHMMITPKQRRNRRTSVSNLDDNNVAEKTVNTRWMQTQNSTQVQKKVNTTPNERSPKFDIEMVKGNENTSFSKAEAAERISDSDSDSSIIPKFTPLPQFKLNMNYVDSDSDPELEQMRLNCERTLARPSTYAPQVRSSKGDRTPRAKRTKQTEQASPVITRRRHQSALSNCNSLNVTHNGNNRKAEISYIAGTVDQSAFVFQEAGDSFKAEGASKTTQSRMSSLAIIRTKRSVDADDAQNRPSKRSKTTTVDENRPKLQQLSPAPVIATELDKKRVSKMPTTLDSFVVMPNSRNRTDSSDLSAIENSVIEETQNEKGDRSQTTRRRAAAANRKKTKVEALSVHSNNSSKENLVLENSDVESVPNTSKARNTRLKRNLNITESSVIKNSSKDEISNSSVDSDSKRKTRGQAIRQKKDVPPKEPVKTKKVATIIQDSDAEGSDESEFLKESKNKSAKTIQSSYSEKSSNSIVVKAKSQNQKDVEQTISGKSDKLDVNLTVDTKSMRTRRVKESDTEKSDSSMIAANKKTNARTRRGKVENSRLEESSSSDNAAMKVNTNDRNKNVKELDSETSDTDISKRSRSTRIKQSGAIKIKPKVEESHKNDLILDSNSEKPDTLVRASRSRRANTRNQSSDSVFSETDTDKDKNSSLTSKSNGSRPVRQTRKRKVPTNVTTVDTTSSEESQEIAEIMKNSIEEDANKNQKRKTRRAKNTPSNSEDTQDSESNNTHVDDVFEKPVSRPKRARLVKSNRNKSLTKNLASDKEVRTRSPQQFSTPQKRTPSPDLPPTPSRLTPSRNRKTMSMSPMKGASYKVLFTGERSEVHRKIVAKLGGSEMEDPEKCSILVTDKVRRTYKFLCCLAQGIPIVSVDWLNDSGKAQRFLNWENYVLQDSAAEAKFKFKLKNSLEKASNHRLLEGYTVLITPRITQPPVAELKGMVISSGGKPLVKPPTKWQENTVIITKDEDLQNAKKFAAKAPKSVTVHSTEFILTGILRQELSLEEFKLTV